ncbi:TIGR00730 family Rossman fold protein [Limnohabitans sp. Rim47]|uniref:LOG family protein n=1 Tax=Limnohabitans sp. Rim47 TaxID=1100721 RepID=UPI00036972BC|nr:TIGR00730 family Rossman fold protein [Limnohabitans sp. Rim47]
MQSIQDLKAPSLPHAWAETQTEFHDAGLLEPQASRLAFADPEFLLRRETRGIRFQLEMLKPDLAQTEAGIEHTVVVFGSARFPDMATALAKLHSARQSDQLQEIAQAETGVRNAQHYENARIFAHLVAQSCSCLPDDEKLYICTGGGPGIMEAANRGAKEAGASSVALNIALPHEQHPNPYVTPELSFKFHYFALRKMHFMMRAKALVAFPGGFGTLDELFEVMTLVQTRKARPVPILLFGSDYWKRLINMDLLVEEGTISQEDLKLFNYVDTPKAAWQVICDFYQLAVTGL